jgi:hypothetical protein
MSPALRALLTRVIDYAGMFPPAKLPLNRAIRAYGKYRQQVECWMLGRFICTAPQLAELENYHDEYFVEGTPVGFSILGRGGDTVDSFSDNLKQDLQEIDDFQKLHGPCVKPDVYEFKCAIPVTSLYPVLVQQVSARELRPLSPFVEFAQPAPAPMLDAIKIIGQSNGARGTANPSGPVGFKLRCGGLEATAFPSVEIVSAVIAACRDHAVPLKFTAGLHHPIRRFDPEMKTHAHGFLNLFVAGVLASAQRIDETRIREIVADENAADFTFGADSLSWKDLRADLAQINQARRTAVTSFGSCSFDEPRDDLRAMGLLR